MKNLIISLIFSIVVINTINSQYDYTLRYGDANGNVYKIWIPPTAQHIRGIFLLFNQMMDNPATDSMIRMACTAEDIAIVSIYNTTDTSLIMAALRNFAQESGFPEIRYAPFATFGHSAAVSAAINFAYLMPSRCFAVVECNGGDYTKPSIDTMDAKRIPIMLIRNYNEQTGGDHTNTFNSVIGNWRAKGYLARAVTLAGGGHFGFGHFDSRFISMFLQKAAHYQIPYDTFATSAPIQMHRVQESAGWLTDTAVINAPLYQTAPFSVYTGSANTAFWHFDAEMANTWMTEHQKEFNKIPQIVSQTTFSPSVGLPNGYWSLWTPAQTVTTGGSINFGASATSGLPITYQAYFGNNSISKDKRTVYLNAARQSWKITDWITIMQTGDDQYRFAETVVKFSVNKRGSGTAQTMSYTPIPDKNVTDVSFRGNDTASSGLLPDMWIESGAIHRSGKNWIIDDFSAKKSIAFIRFVQPGNATFATSNLIIDTIHIFNNRLNQSITFDNLGGIIDILSNSKTLHAEGSSGNTPKFFCISGPAVVNGNSMTLTGVPGIITLLAMIPGNNIYNSVKALQYVIANYSTGVQKEEIKTTCTVYPNPTHDIIYVNLDEPAEVILYDIYGKPLQSAVSKEKRTSFMLSDYPPGIYSIKVMKRNGTEVLKFIVM